MKGPALFDLILRGGTVIDGTKAPRFPADVAVAEGRIAQVGNLAEATAAREIDVTDLIVAPGLIDVHNHSDGWLLRTPQLVPKITQGFTTEVLMADGISYAPVSPENAREWFFYLRSLNGLRLDEYTGWRTIEEYLNLLAGRNVQNVAAHIPYANLQALACGFGPRRVDNFQMREIQAAICHSMEQGAVGLSTGLDYISQCYCDTEELVAACQAMQPYDGLYVTHVRYKIGLLPALREAVEIGRRAGVRVHVSHLKGQTLEETEQILEFIDREARNEVKFTFDVYPYQPGSTMLNYLLPYEAWDDGPLGVMARMRQPEVFRRFAAGLKTYLSNLDKITIAWMPGQENSVHIGKSLSQYVAQQSRPPEEALYDLLFEERLACLLVFQEGPEPYVRHMLKHDLCLLGTDGIYFPDSVVHPRVYGSTGRWLGAAVRDWKLFSLEEAVHKASGLSASRFRLPDVGVVRAGAHADLTVFNPDTITDQATFEAPHQTTIGIEHVLVSGVPIISNGEVVPREQLPAVLPGRRIRSAVAIAR